MSEKFQNCTIRLYQDIKKGVVCDMGSLTAFVIENKEQIATVKEVRRVFKKGAAEIEVSIQDLKNSIQSSDELKLLLELYWEHSGGVFDIDVWLNRF